MQIKQCRLEKLCRLSPRTRVLIWPMPQSTAIGGSSRKVNQVAGRRSTVGVRSQFTTAYDQRSASVRLSLRLSIHDHADRSSRPLGFRPLFDLTRDDRHTISEVHGGCNPEQRRLFLPSFFPPANPDIISRTSTAFQSEHASCKKQRPLCSSRMASRLGKVAKPKDQSATTNAIRCHGRFHVRMMSRLS